VSQVTTRSFRPFTVLVHGRQFDDKEVGNRGMRRILGTILATGAAVAAFGLPATAAPSTSTDSVRITNDSVRITNDSVRITAAGADNREW
jgi:hypothetical protein